MFKDVRNITNASFSGLVLLVVVALTHRSGSVDQEDELNFLVSQAEARHERDHSGNAQLVRRLLDDDGGLVRVRARDQDDNVPIQVAGLPLQLACHLKLAILVGFSGDGGGELVARAGDRLDLRISDNIDVDLQRGRGVQAVRDLRDELRSFGGVGWRDVPRRNRGRNSEANSLVLNRELGDVL